MISCALLTRLMLISLDLYAVKQPASTSAAGSTASYAGGKMARSSTFVSSGALGVTRHIGKAEASLLCPAAACAVRHPYIVFDYSGTSAARRAPDCEAPAPVFLGARAVPDLNVIRAYVGSSIPISWKTNALRLPRGGVCRQGGGRYRGPVRCKNDKRRHAAVVPLLCLGYDHPCCARPVLVQRDHADHAPSLRFHNQGLVRHLGLLCGNVPVFFVLPAGCRPSWRCVVVSALCC